MATISGTAHADDLAGTGGSDLLNLDSGADTVAAAGGADTVNGGGGDDVAAGGAGADVLYGFGKADVKANSGVIQVSLVADGFSAPLFAASPAGDDRLFVVEKGTGRIEILDPDTGQVLATPFLDLPADEFSFDGERGLLGLAFHPDYAANGRFYVNFTAPNGDITIREYTRSADPNVADAGSARTILTIPHRDASNHNGGWIGFGPNDGYLYIATGDGGGGGDANNDAQNLDNLLGKMLRIDVDGDDFASTSKNYAIPDGNPFAAGAGADEIWAYGLRNPWRNSFDRLTGDMYIGDVGQGRFEEIDFIAAGSPGGLNFGWHVKEGFHDYDTDTPGNPDPGDPSLIDPLVELPHDDSPFAGQSITGGYVYRGPGGGQGLYFFADFVEGNFFSLGQADGTAEDFANRNAQLRGDLGGFGSIASFAEDGLGRLYAISLGGSIFLISPSAAAGDGNDRLDGGAGDDKAYGGAGDDKLDGGADDDRLFGGIGDDTVYGGSGDDELRGHDGEDVLGGEAGADTLDGGAGRDTVKYKQASAGVEVSLAVRGDQDTGGGGVDQLISIEILIGSSFGDRLTGDGRDNLLDGRLGGDTLSGGNGADTLEGGLGADRLFGGRGADLFRFAVIGDLADGDRIGDLGRTDTIDLRGIDADTGRAGNQAFRLVESFSGEAGEAVLTFDVARDRTVLSLDVDSDGVADGLLIMAGDQRGFDGLVL